VSRHGESTHNLAGRIGGNAPLSPLGEEYGKALGHFISSSSLDPGQPFLISKWIM